MEIYKLKVMHPAIIMIEVFAFEENYIYDLKSDIYLASILHILELVLYLCSSRIKLWKVMPGIASAISVYKLKIKFWVIGKS